MNRESGHDARSAGRGTKPLLAVLGLVADVVAIIGVFTNPSPSIAFVVLSCIAIVAGLILVVRLFGRPLGMLALAAFVLVLAGSVTLAVAVTMRATATGGADAAGDDGDGVRSPTTSAVATTTPSTSPSTSPTSPVTSSTGRPTTTSRPVEYQQPVSYPLELSQGVAVDLDSRQATREGGADFEFVYPGGLNKRLHFGEGAQVASGTDVTLVSAADASPQNCASSTRPQERYVSGYFMKDGDVICFRTTEGAWAAVNVREWGATGGKAGVMDVTLWKPQS